LKRNIEKRLEELERRLGPKKKSKPGLIFFHHVHGDDITDEEFEASMKGYDAAQNAEYEKHKKSGNADPALVVTIVHTPKGKGGDVGPGREAVQADPEPAGAALEAEIEELERRKATLRGRS